MKVERAVPARLPCAERVGTSRSTSDADPGPPGPGYVPLVARFGRSGMFRRISLRGMLLVSHSQPCLGRAACFSFRFSFPMKALLLRAYNEFELTDFPEPVIAPDEVLVRVKACGICGSDVHGMTGSTGRRIPPIVIGHEAS